MKGPVSKFNNMERYYYVLHPRATVKEGGRFEWVLSLGTEYGPIVDIYAILHKSEAEHAAAYTLTMAARDFGQRSELCVRGLNGKYSPARTYPRSGDPRRSKG